MSTLTPRLSLRKAVSSDDIEVYLVTELGATLDILDEAVLRTSVDTLTNKTLTSPVINTPTINTPTISNPALNGTVTTSGLTLPAHTISGNLVFSAATLEVIANTSDGSDSSRLLLGGGGSVASSGSARGAALQLHGNEHGTSPGKAFLDAGDVSTGDITLRTGAALANALTFSRLGVLGLNVTPKAWGSAIKALQMGVGAAIGGHNSLNIGYLLANVWYDGTDFKSFTNQPGWRVLLDANSDVVQFSRAAAPGGADTAFGAFAHLLSIDGASGSVSIPGASGTAAPGGRIRLANGGAGGEHIAWNNAAGSDSLGIGSDSTNRMHLYGWATSGSAGAVSTYLRVNLNGTEFKIALLAVS